MEDQLKGDAKLKSIEATVLLLFWSATFLLAIIFRYERLFADSSYYFFHSINQGYPQLDHQRFVLAIAEFLPLVGSYIHLPLNVLVLLYSLGHVLFSFALFSNVYFKHGDRGHGLLILLLQFTAYTHLFFSPMLELWYGLILLVFLDHRLSINKIDGLKNQLLLLVLSLCVMFSHPENFVVLALVLAFRWKKGQLPLKLIVGSVLLIVAVSVFKFATFSDYESGKVMNAQNNTAGGITGILEIGYLKQLATMLITNYYDCLLYILIGIVAFWKKKQKSSALIIFASAIGFIAFINVTLHRNEYGRYSESCYLPLAFIGLFTISMAWNILSPRGKTWIGAMLVIFSLVRLNLIVTQGESLSERKVQMLEFIEIGRNEYQQKMVLMADSIQTEYSRIGWSYAIESLVLSSLNGSDRSVSVIFDEDIDYQDNATKLNTTNFVLRRHEILEYGELNQRYFKLPEVNYSNNYVKRD